MSKTLNQAFLRAYAKDNRSESAIPAPHAFAASHGQSPSHPMTEHAETAHLPEVHVSAPASSALAHTIPAPHIAFPTTFATATQQLDSHHSLLLSQIDTTAMISDSPSIAALLSHSRPTVARPLAIEPANDPPRAPISGRAPGSRFSIHQPHPAPSHQAPARDVPPPASTHPQANSPAPEAPPSSQPSTSGHQPIDAQSPAAWEVDHFGWTDECNRLFETLASAFDEAGEQLRTVTQEGLHVLVVSSTYRGEGRTVVASLLARAAARAGVSVALFDADVDNPQLAGQLKVQLGADWLQVLLEGLPLEEAAVASTHENIIAYPLRRETREKAIRLNDPNVVSVLQRVAEKVDLVIVDLGPYSSDQRRMFPAGDHCPIDAAIVVRDIRSTSDQQAAMVAQSLRQMGVEAVGIAENFIWE